MSTADPTRAATMPSEPVVGGYACDPDRDEASGDHRLAHGPGFFIRRDSPSDTHSQTQGQGIARAYEIKPVVTDELKGVKWSGSPQSMVEQLERSYSAVRFRKCGDHY